MQRKETHYLPPVNERFVTKTSIGFGGFPGPIALARRLYGYILSKLPDEKANRLRLVRPTHSLLVPTGKGSSGQLARYDTKQVRLVPPSASLLTRYISGAILLLRCNCRKKLSIP